MKQLIYFAFALLFLSILIPSANSIIEKRNHNRDEISILEASSQQSYFVTVEAGFSNGAKSSTSGSDGRSSLRSGDKLYVRAVISDSTAEKIMAGFLSVSDVPKGATTAKFSGALSVYVWQDAQAQFVKAKHVFDNVDDPLSECESVFAMLVDKEADNFRVSEEDRRGCFSVCIAPNVNTLRKKSVETFGWYDSSARFIALNSDNPETSAPIFNYSISGGLTPNASYNVYYISSSNGSNEFPSYSLGTVTADVEGKVSFACYNFCAGDDHVHEVRFVNKKDNNDVRLVALGIKSGASKVYDITGAAIPESRVMAMASER